MKIRYSYVSNSSSSSFIICGDNVIELIKAGISRNETVYADSYYGIEETEIINIGKLNEKIYNVLDTSEQNLFNLIYGEMTGIASYYIDFNDKLESYSIYKFSDESIKLIEEYKMIANKYKHDYKKLRPYEKAYCNSIAEDVKNIIKELKSKYKEVVTIRVGDNHGDITGTDGWYIESEYLGRKLINTELQTKFDIIRINEH